MIHWPCVCSLSRFQAYSRFQPELWFASWTRRILCNACLWPTLRKLLLYVLHHVSNLYAKESSLPPLAECLMWSVILSLPQIARRWYRSDWSSDLMAHIWCIQIVPQESVIHIESRTLPITETRSWFRLRNMDDRSRLPSDPTRQIQIHRSRRR